MDILHTVGEVRSRSEQLAGKRLALIPTMGALHPGHLSLIRAARLRCEVVAASIFVNPLQFGGNEDLARYPRTFPQDCELLEQAGVAFVFAPSAAEMYPGRALTYVEVEDLSHKLCGRSRPGHFRGVSTVVAKLFNIFEPDLAYFGQKDAAQLAIIRRMVHDLNLSVQIVAGATVREADGLAMSSRNAYLDAQQRKSALLLYRCLQQIQNRFQQGERDAAQLSAGGRQLFVEEPAVRLDYLEVVDPDTLDPVTEICGRTLVAVAGFLGTTRLIDNILLETSPPEQVL
jgi:pantoate--beta-alanine ligase